jgi:hypothetical protein
MQNKKFMKHYEAGKGVIVYNNVVVFFDYFLA